MHDTKGANSMKKRLALPLTALLAAAMLAGCAPAQCPVHGTEFRYTYPVSACGMHPRLAVSFYFRRRTF